ncbi:MAG: hypothetical protein RBT76_00610 [candidate division Zixibacteria bacterium]|jgi:hypothetical protein|nr:hypothetical protein [candidate division Zixibacteria bacterium]
MKKAAVLALALVIGVVGAVQGFDGERKGFVLGGGIGYASSVKTTVDVSASSGFGDQFYLGTLENDEKGLAGQLMFGFGWDDRNMLVLESNVAVYSINDLNLYGDGFLYDVQFAQGVGTVSWYHYWGGRGSSIFTAIGGGLGYFDTDYTDPNDYDFAWLAAIGYEFTAHLQLGVYYTSGKTVFTEVPGLQGDFTQTNLSVLLSAVAF